MLNRKLIPWLDKIRHKEHSVYILLAFLFAMVVFITIILNLQISEWTGSLDRVITGKYEGALSKNMGFIAMLTAEISKNIDPDCDEERQITKNIKYFLSDISDYCQKKIKRSSEYREVPASANIENQNPLDLCKWLHPLNIERINYKNLNLEIKEHHEPLIRPYLSSIENKKQYLETGKDPKSIVLIPSQLVSYENGNVSISNTIKKEVIFSKCIETKLLEVYKKNFAPGNSREKVEIFQAYFIPLSGFVRISKRDPASLNLDILPKMSCFSDRPYFKGTLKIENDGIRVSNPYIDSAGSGIICTYSIFIRNEDLGITGMIGIDRKMLSMEKALDKVKLGSTFINEFRIETYSLKKYENEKEKKKIEDTFGTPFLINEIKNALDDPGTAFQDDVIIRIESDEVTVYAVKVEEKLKCFILDHANPGNNNLFIVLYYILFLLLLAVSIIISFWFFRSKIKTQQIHSEVVTHVNGGLLILDADGNIKFNNAKMSQLLDEPNLTGKNFLAHYLDNESRSDYNDFIQEAREDFKFAGKIKRSDNTVSPVIISGASIYYPDVENARMMIVIPSEQLEGAIASSFIHGFAHALKTPIQSILLLADRLRRKRARPKFDHYYALMRREVEEFSNMVDSLLKFSKLEIENVRPDFEMQNIASLLRSAIKPFKEKASKTQITISERIPKRLSAKVDVGMFKSIINNILGNAMKYTNEGKIMIKSSASHTDIMIIITDTGMGIREDEQEKIFDRFFRSRDQAVRSKDGIGIGLYLSRKYALLHGGTLTYSPNPNERGSRFILKLPKS